MRITKLPKALSQALRKFKPLRKDINDFKTKLSHCLNSISIAEDNQEHEENFKNYIAEFLKNSLYQDHLINTKERIDLAIYSGTDANSHISVLIEVKRPSNTNEFLSSKNINKKALHELLLYYLKERVDKQNNNIKHLIATNGYEWYLFKGEDFYTYFYKNARLKKEYEAFRDGEKDSTKNELFYNEIATKYIDEVGENLNYVYFNTKDYEPYLDLENKKDNKLVSLYKTLSSTHLLNKAFGNDSNQLNKAFYGELLHLIGLEEVKEKGKKVIQRLPKGKREYGSLLESAIFTLDDRDYLQNVPNLRTYGTTKEEQLFNVGLELCLTWINRVLFLKLLESQLLGYHDNNKNYRFLNQEFIQGFDDLEALFFSALAKKQSDRNERHQDKYQYVPYLNSSLFEPSDLEKTAMQLSNVKDEKIKLHDKTVLKDGNNKRLKGEKNTLSYLFDFLEAYDFSSDGKAQIEEGEQSKALINASVLGLIFEKINGYKDGSFYTPSYITMYMSRETLRRAVVQKMNTHYNWKCSDFEDLKEDLRDYIKEQGKERNKARLKANEVVNSLKICDPAVGSGHFLVSCLNELISIKSDLKILCDEKGERLDTYIALENDELIIEDENGDFFSYAPTIERTHQVQKALFHEKQTLIENCLFAVDINPNSVKICRLRLWIELLKNAYYNKDQVLQTLPNIDINIKCGNSLISRFGLEDDLKAAFKSKENPYSLRDYKNAVKEYKQTNDKARKKEVQTIINTIKGAFKDSLDKKFINKIANARGRYIAKNEQFNTLFGAKKTKKDKAELKRLKTALDKLEAQKEETLNNVIYQNAFEWRFEFPEVLDNKGAFLGFDVVIGNPPYINFANLPQDYRSHLKVNKLYKNKTDLYAFFIDLAKKIAPKTQTICLIIPHTWISTSSFSPLRKMLLVNNNIKRIVEFDFGVFKDAYVKTVIIELGHLDSFEIEILDENFNHKVSIPIDVILKDPELKINFTWTQEKQYIFNKIFQGIKSLGDIIHFSRGIKTSNDKRFINVNKKDNEYYKVIRGRNIKAYKIDYQGEYIWYRPDLMKEKVGCLPHTIDMFLTKEKLITQRINSSGQLLATYDNNQYFCLDTTNVSKEIYDKSYSLKYLVGIINSSLINWWFNDIFKNPTISGYELNKIPIKPPFQYDQRIIIIVDKILLLKDENPKADTTQLEQEIDVLVYQLYGLTYKEVLIVDPAFHLSKDAYEVLS